jgi:hypothetical protein
MGMKLHDADEVVGRVRNDGGWDRRYRRHTDPEPDEPMPTIVQVLLGVIVLLSLIVGTLAWLAILAVHQAPVVR